MITKREEALWKIIDDIDSALDMFKPKQDAFTNFIARKSEERHTYLISDGYTLKEPANEQDK